jgi:hypothetical protein
MTLEQHSLIALKQKLVSPNHQTSSKLTFLAVPQLRRLVAGFQRQRPGFDNVDFLVDKGALEHVFSEYFSLSCPSSFHQFFTITIIYHLGLIRWASNGRSTEWAVTPLRIKKTDISKTAFYWDVAADMEVCL